MNKVTIYTKNYCPYCVRAKALLNRKDVAFTEIDVTFDRALHAEMVERSCRRTVPQVFVGDVPLGGSDDLADAENSGRLDTLLGRQLTT